MESCSRILGVWIVAVVQIWTVTLSCLSEQEYILRVILVLVCVCVCVCVTLLTPASAVVGQ